MSDVPSAGTTIRQDDYVDKAKIADIKAKLNALSKDMKQTNRAIEDAEFKLKSSQLDYANAQASYENWLKTRSATDSSLQNPAVIMRTKEIEQLKLNERIAERVIEDLNQTKVQQSRQFQDAQTVRKQIDRDARAPYNKARKMQTLKIFLFRLAITLPLLLLSGWMIAKKRGSKYWPIYRGFIIFSLFAFFVELVPYLPSYGGYVRYTVGIVLALIFAHFTIGGMTRYLQRKQAEESKPETEKRSMIQYETAVKKITDGTCPSCDRSYGAKKDQDVDYCVHCGFCLFTKCSNCGDRENSFFKFCGVCGQKANDSINEQTA